MPKKTNSSTGKARKPRARRRHTALGSGQIHRGKISGVPTLSEDHYAFCSAFARTNSAEGAAAYAGFHPKTGWRLLHDPDIQAEIVRCKERLAQREDQKADKAFEVDRSYVNAKVVHFLETFQTHERRGDADRVGVLEIAAKCTGQIQPARIINNNLANASAQVAGATMAAVYKSRWMIDNEEKIRLHLEAENAQPAVNESANLTS